MANYETLPGWDFCYKLLNEHHIVIGGGTGSGKSVLLDDIIFTATSYRPHDLQMFLIDIKRVGLKKWKNDPHVVSFVTEIEDIVPCLKRINRIMDDRYKEMDRLNLEQTTRSDIYVIIDEANEVLRQKGVIEHIDRLMRIARAAGIHLIMATQDVSRSTGIPARIFKNASCRIGLRCESAVDSRQVIGIGGCEKLPLYGQCYIRNGRGELLYQNIPLTQREDIDIRVNHNWKRSELM